MMSANDLWALNEMGERARRWYQTGELEFAARLSGVTLKGVDMAIDNYTVGQIGGRLLGEHLHRQTRKYMQRFTDKVKMTVADDPQFMAGYAGQRLRFIMDELEDVWEHATPDQKTAFLERLGNLK